MIIVPKGDGSSKGNLSRLAVALVLVAIVIFLATHWHWIGHKIGSY
jgi:hypothetical protein